MVLLKSWLLLCATFASMALIQMHQTSRMKEFQVMGNRTDLDLSLPERLLLAAKMCTSLANLLINLVVLDVKTYVNMFVYNELGLLPNMDTLTDIFVTCNEMESTRKKLIYVLLNIVIN